MRLFIEFCLTSGVFLFFPSLSLYFFIYSSFATALITQKKLQTALWIIAFFSFLQESLISPYSPFSGSLSLCLLTAVTLYRWICAKITLDGIFFALGCNTALWIGFAVYMYLFSKNTFLYTKVSFLIESYAISFGFFITRSCFSWLMTQLQRRQYVARQKLR